MAELNSVQSIRAKVDRHDAVIDWTWNTVKNFMFVFGGIAILAWLVWIGYKWGSSGCYTCTQNQPAAVTAPKPQAAIHSPETATETKPVLAEKPAIPVPMPVPATQVLAPQVTASATSTSAQPVQPQPIIVRVEVSKSSHEPIVEKPTEPCAGMTGAELRRCQIWKPLIGKK